MPSAVQRPMFSDKVIKATELNRASGRVLDQALESPLTIVRNEQQFALLSRDLMSVLSTELYHSGNLLDLMITVVHILLGHPIGSEHPYGWLRAFDQEELGELYSEITDAYRKVSTVPDGWEELEAVIHEWKESAIAILSDDLAAAWSASDEEVPLTSPDQVGVPS